jgi:EmrB/QacA subfamily drug resistance transporter
LPNEKSLNWLLWIAAVGFFMQTLDSTIVNTALPAMAQSFGERPLRMQSVVVAYSLTMAMLIPASGWIADKFGTRRVYIAAIVLFVIGSVCCALAQNLAQLVSARVLQGIGGAMLMPVGRLAVLRAFPQERFLRAMSFVTIPGLIGPLIGPALGGWLVQVASWQWIFLINVPVGMLGCIATWIYMPDGRERVGRFDVSGYAMLAFGMVGISLSLDGLAGLGIQPVTVRVLLIFGLASIAAYWLHATRKPHPLFSPTLFRVPTFSIGLLGNLFGRIGSGSMPFLIPLLLQIGLGYSPFQAGMMMVPVAIAGIASKALATRVIRRLGYRRMLVGNTILVGLAMASFALITPEQPLWLRIVQLAFFGGVNSMQFTAMNTVTLKDLLGYQTSSGNSLLSMVMMLSMSLGVASAGALLANFEDRFGHDSAAQALSAFHATFISVGLITLASAWIFWQLSSDEKPPARKVESVEIG